MTSTMARPEVRHAEVEPQLTPAQRLAQAAALRPFKTKEVDLGPLGRFKFRELKQREIEDVNEPLVRRTIGADGKVTATTDSRGHQARAIASAMVNDDMTPAFPSMAEGVAIINELPKDVVEKLWQAVDELNLLSTGAKEEAGKSSGTMPKNSGGQG